MNAITFVEYILEASVDRIPLPTNYQYPHYPISFTPLVHSSVVITSKAESFVQHPTPHSYNYQLASSPSSP